MTWLSELPIDDSEYLYAYDEDGERFEEEIIGTQFEGIGTPEALAVAYRFVNSNVSQSISNEIRGFARWECFDNIVVDCER